MFMLWSPETNNYAGQSNRHSLADIQRVPYKQKHVNRDGAVYSPHIGTIRHSVRSLRSQLVPYKPRHDHDLQTSLCRVRIST